jgi:hypothetical protein
LALESRLHDISKSDAEYDSQEIDDVCFAINSLREESLQVTELLKLEDYYAKEIIGELKQIMRPKKASFHLNPLTMLEQNSSISDAVLNYEGVVSFKDSKGHVVFRKPLAEFQIETFLKIIDEILHEAKNLLISESEKHNEALSAIKKISIELRKMIYGEEGPQEQTVAEKS